MSGRPTEDSTPDQADRAASGPAEETGSTAWILRLRQSARRAIRAYFDAEGFTEVDTPALQRSPGIEPHLHAFRTERLGPDLTPAGPHYLHTSPEFAMKRLLASGSGPIYQLAHVFRNAEDSPIHHPEFTMLEWYRVQATHTALMDDCDRLLATLAAALNRPMIEHSGGRTDITRTAVRVSLCEAFETYAGIDLAECLTPEGAFDRDRLGRAASRADCPPRPGDTDSDLFFRVLGERIEPNLGWDRPTLLYDYPACEAALARIRSDDPRFAERVELYVCGHEIANGFSELTDATEQRRRFEHDLAVKEALYGQRYPVDETFLQALEDGMPDSAGMALGFDRLLMLMAGAPRLDAILSLPVHPAQTDR